MMLVFPRLQKLRAARRRSTLLFRFVCAALIAAGLLLLTPLQALACGGLFSPGATIYQNTERMIFAVDPGSVTLYEQISYSGSAKDFAWVLPVPATPKVDTASIDLFRDLDTITAPVFVPETPPPCGLPALQGPGNYTGSAPPPSNVDVYSSGTVGPYAYDVVGSGDPQALTAWLSAHHYHVPDNMQSLIQPYTQAKMRFLALRLQPQAQVQDIKPVKITIPSSQPQIMIPIRMAAAASAPRLGMLVWIFGSARYLPQNYQAAQIDDAQISSSPYPGANYNQLVEGLVNKAGGHAFVTEYAGPTSRFAQNPLLTSLVRGHAYMTRLYTRLAPNQMTLDPTFAPQSSQPDVSNIHYAPAAQTCDPFNRVLGSLGVALGPAFYPCSCGGLIVLALLIVGIVFFTRRRHAARKQAN